MEPSTPFSARAEHIISLVGLRSLELGWVMCLTRNLDGSGVIIDSIWFLGSLASPLVLQRMEIRETELLTVGPVPGKATGNQAWVLAGVSCSQRQD